MKSEIINEMKELEKDDESEGSIKFPLQPLAQKEHHANKHPSGPATSSITTTRQQKKNTNGESLQHTTTNSNSNSNKHHAVPAPAGVKNKIKRLSGAVNVDIAQRFADKAVGLGAGAMLLLAKEELGTSAYPLYGPIEEHEAKVRRENASCWLVRFVTTLWSSILVFMVYLITLETLMSCALCVGLTIYWYDVVSLFKLLKE